MCGENGANMNFENRREGSPPRVRGKPKICMFLSWTTRITPACAGKTHWTAAGFAVLRDHPRVCGENGTPSTLVPALIGSPPRVRGKHDVVRGGAGDVGITPACAGKTLFSYLSSCQHQDHPRVCGENRASLETRVLTMGSPPRVRGKLAGLSIYLCGRGITPACAGKTAGERRQEGAL